MFSLFEIVNAGALQDVRVSDPYPILSYQWFVMTKVCV